VFYSVSVNGSAANEADNVLQIQANLYDKEGILVANATSDQKLGGKLQVNPVKPWWPYLMHSDPGYLYNLQFELFVASNEKELESLQDTYRLPVGIRSLSWDNDSLLLNGKPLYLRGFGRHEDSDVSLIVG